MKKLLFLFIGTMLMMSCISQKQLRKEIPLIDKELLENDIPPLIGYTDQQADSFYTNVKDILYRSRYIAKRFMSLNDTLYMRETKLNSRLSELDSHLSELENSLRNTYSIKPKIIYSRTGAGTRYNDDNFTDTFKTNPVPTVLHFFVMFNRSEPWRAIGTFSVNLQNTDETNYGVTCPEGVDGAPKADFKASYSVRYDAATRVLTVKRERIGRVTGKNNWVGDLGEEDYGIQSVVAIY